MYILASFVKDKVSICAWIYLWAFYFVPLINISVFVPVPYCLGNCGCVVEPDVRSVDSSSSSLLSQDSTILDAWGWCTGMTQRDGMGREEGSRWGTRVYLWWIHVDIWHNQYNIVKLKKKTVRKKKKNKTNPASLPHFEFISNSSIGLTRLDIICLLLLLFDLIYFIVGLFFY